LILALRIRKRRCVYGAESGPGDKLARAERARSQTPPIAIGGLLISRALRAASGILRSAQNLKIQKLKILSGGFFWGSVKSGFPRCAKNARSAQRAGEG
jgi:hypothetical protein